MVMAVNVNSYKNSDDICGNAADNTHNSDDRIMMIES